MSRRRRRRRRKVFGARARREMCAPRRRDAARHVEVQSVSVGSDRGEEREEEEEEEEKSYSGANAVNEGGRGRDRQNTSGPGGTVREGVDR